MPPNRRQQTLTLGTPRIPKPDDEAGRKAHAEKLIGSVLSDRYRVDAVIASGAMASVYRGLHLKMRKQVAIKILHPETEDFPDLVQRFEREAVAGAHISHPNVATASDMGTFGDGSYFLVLEYVPGRTLRDVVSADAPMEPKRAVKLARQLASALAAVHAKGIIHRDLKPRNIMVTNAPDEAVKLIDFGLARVIVEDVAPLENDVPNPMKRSLSATGVVFGTVGYMAPETALGMKAVGAQSDLYSLGVILYEMLAGEHPFSAADPRELFALHRSAPPAPLSRGKIVVPRALEKLVMDLLEKDPSKRIQTAEDVISRLDTALDPEPPSGHAVEKASQKPPATRSGGKALALGGVVAAAIGVFAIYWFFLRPKPAAPPISPVETASAAPIASTSSAPPAAIDSASLGAKSADDAAAGVRLANQLLASTDKSDAASIVVQLADVAPLALRDDRIRAAAKSAAEKIADGNRGDADKLYYAVTYKFGTDGLDLLYDIAAHSTSTAAARRAGAILDIQGASPRATPALRIAVELGKATCSDKQLLLPKAARDGDARTVEILQKLEPPACNSSSPCCLPHSVELERTIAAIQQRAASK